MTEISRLRKYFLFCGLIFLIHFRLSQSRPLPRTPGKDNGGEQTREKITGYGFVGNGLFEGEKKNGGNDNSMVKPLFNDDSPLKNELNNIIIQNLKSQGNDKEKEKEKEPNPPPKKDILFFSKQSKFKMERKIKKEKNDGEGSGSNSENNNYEENQNDKTQNNQSGYNYVFETMKKFFLIKEIKKKIKLKKVIKWMKLIIGKKTMINR